jgi:hypothetical protein
VPEREHGYRVLMTGRARRLFLIATLVTGLSAATGAAAHRPARDRHPLAPVPPFAPNLDPGESNRVSALPPLRPSGFPQAEHVGFHEFQADCSVNRVAPDDPLVHPRQPGISHSHTFVGARANVWSTTKSLTAAPTSCVTRGDHSAYWFPTLYDGSKPILPKGPQIIYYKSGIEAYNTVRAFPRGLRFISGNPGATQIQFQHDSGASGWTCGNTGPHYDFPQTCQTDTNLIVRYQAPSCWDGKHLDSPNHRSHMAYPVSGACPASHPVAVPMLEFKIAYPVSGDVSRLMLSSGRGYSWHADFFAAWDMPTEEALVTQCINGGGQCDARGYDQHKSERAQVLDSKYELIK